MNERKKGGQAGWRVRTSVGVYTASACDHHYGDKARDERAPCLGQWSEALQRLSTTGPRTHAPGLPLTL